MMRADPLAKVGRELRMTTTRVQGFLTEDERERLLAEEAPDYVRLILMLGFFDGVGDVVVGDRVGTLGEGVHISC